MPPVGTFSLSLRIVEIFHLPNAQDACHGGARARAQEAYLTLTSAMNRILLTLGARGDNVEAEKYSMLLARPVCLNFG